jgi:hypothetical protein
MFVELSRYLPGNPFLQGLSSISNTKSTNIAIIIGPVLGGILALVIIIFLALCIKRKYHTKGFTKTKERTLTGGHLQMVKSASGGKQLTITKTKERTLTGGHLQMVKSASGGKQLTIYIHIFCVIQQ